MERNDANEKHTDSDREINELERVQTLIMIDEAISLRRQFEAAETELWMMKADYDDYQKQIDRQSAAFVAVCEYCKVKTLKQIRKNPSQEKSIIKTNLKAIRALGHRMQGKQDDLSNDFFKGAGIFDKEARLLCEISACLSAYPFGATTDYICSCALEVDNSLSATDVENLMKRFPSLFKEEPFGISASGKMWKFIGFLI